MAEIDRNLQVRARELRRTRERIARLRAGDRLFPFVLRTPTLASNERGTP